MSEPYCGEAPDMVRTARPESSWYSSITDINRQTSSAGTRSVSDIIDRTWLNGVPLGTVKWFLMSSPPSMSEKWTCASPSPATWRNAPPSRQWNHKEKAVKKQ